VEQGLVLPALVDAALTRQQQVKEAHGSAGSSGAGTIRVDAQKLDHLINLVGEMIMRPLAPAWPPAAAATAPASKPPRCWPGWWKTCATARCSCAW
jgi:hypothetical protein